MNDNTNEFNLDIGLEELFTENMDGTEETEGRYVVLRQVKIIEYVREDGQSGVVAAFENVLDETDSFSYADRLRIIALANASIISDYTAEHMLSTYGVIEEDYDEEQDED